MSVRGWERQQQTLSLLPLCQWNNKRDFNSTEVNCPFLSITVSREITSETEPRLNTKAVNIFALAIMPLEIHQYQLCEYIKIHWYLAIIMFLNLFDIHWPVRNRLFNFVFRGRIKVRQSKKIKTIIWSKLDLNAR